MQTAGSWLPLVDVCWGVAVSYNNGPECVTGAHLARTCLRRGSVRATGAWWGDGGCVEVQFSWDCRRRKSQVCSEVDQQGLTKRLCEGLYAVWKGDCLLGGVVARTDPLVGQKAMDRKLEWGQCCNGDQDQDQTRNRRRDNLKTVECDNDCLPWLRHRASACRNGEWACLTCLSCRSGCTCQACHDYARARASWALRAAAARSRWAPCSVARLLNLSSTALGELEALAG